MTQSTYNPYLLYANNHTLGFGVIRLQTDDTLILADKTFAAAKDTQLRKAKLLAKKREILTPSTLIKFNGRYIRQLKNIVKSYANSSA